MGNVNKEDKENQTLEEKGFESMVKEDILLSWCFKHALINLAKR